MRDKKWVLNTPNLQSLWWWPWPRSMAPESHGLSGLGRGLGGGGGFTCPARLWFWQQSELGSRLDNQSLKERTVPPSGRSRQAGVGEWGRKDGRGVVSAAQQAWIPTTL